MLGQRRRRWANLSSTLGQRLVFAGTTLLSDTYAICLLGVDVITAVSHQYSLLWFFSFVYFIWFVYFTPRLVYVTLFCYFFAHVHSGNTTHRHYPRAKLGQRIRRGPNFASTLNQCIVLPCIHILSTQMWPLQNRGQTETPVLNVTVHRYSQLFYLLNLTTLRYFCSTF